LENKATIESFIYMWVIMFFFWRFKKKKRLHVNGKGGCERKKLWISPFQKMVVEREYRGFDCIVLYSNLAGL
jgi:hypothetical protein